VKHPKTIQGKEKDREEEREEVSNSTSYCSLRKRRKGKKNEKKREGEGENKGHPPSTSLIMYSGKREKRKKRRKSPRCRMDHSKISTPQTKGRERGGKIAEVRCFSQGATEGRGGEKKTKKKRGPYLSEGDVPVPQKAQMEKKKKKNVP